MSIDDDLPSGRRISSFDRQSPSEDLLPLEVAECILRTAKLDKVGGNGMGGDTSITLTGINSGRHAVASAIGKLLGIEDLLIHLDSTGKECGVILNGTKVHEFRKTKPGERIEEVRERSGANQLTRRRRFLRPDGEREI